MFSRLFKQCTGKLSVAPRLRPERDTIFALAKLQLDYANPVHSRILNTIYVELTNSNNVHWETIGFQSPNPQTDLRAAGMLGLLQILYYIDMYPDSLVAFYKISTNKVTEFPFAVSLLGWTAFALTSLREGRLSSIINQKGSVIDVFNAFYCSCFWFFMQDWCENKMNIQMYGQHFNYCKGYCRTHIKQVMKRFLSTNTSQT